MYCISNDHHLCSMIKTMAEKLCLQWNDFKENVNSAFGKLRDDKEFTNVTLVCEDGQQMEHMGSEYVSREKKSTMVNFLIFVQKNVSRIRFQEIKIRPLKGFEKMRFLCFYIIGV